MTPEERDGQHGLGEGGRERKLKTPGDIQAERGKGENRKYRGFYEQRRKDIKS